MSKTFQFTNRHGRQVHLDQEQAKFIYGQPSMQFDGEVIIEKECVKENGKYKKDEDGNYIYSGKKIVKLDPDSTPGSESNDYVNTGKRIELKSGMNKGGSEMPASRYFKNKKSVK